MRLTGIEPPLEAIACARSVSRAAGAQQFAFSGVLDSMQFATTKRMPRSWCGIGAEPCDHLSRMAPPHIIYSSRNARTMATDIARLSGYRVGAGPVASICSLNRLTTKLTLLVREVKQNVKALRR